MSKIQTLIDTGKLDQAEKLLRLEGDGARFESYRGILWMKRDQPEKAIEHFKRVLRQQPNQTAVWLYLGQAYFQMQRYRESLRSLDKGKAIGSKIASYFKLKARAQERVGYIEKAYKTLSEAEKRFPLDREIIREQALLLVNAGLYAMALKKGREYLSNRSDDRDGYVILSEALRRAGRPREAAEILEDASVRFRQDAEIVGRLALAYAESGQTFAAAKLFSRSTAMSGDYQFAAAETYRLAGRFREAIRMNAFVTDTKKQLSQRLAIYLGSEAFDRATALTQRMQDAGIMNDTNRYRLAYAHLRVGDLDRAEALAIQVSDPTLIQSAQDVRKQVEKERAR
ncbi:MAG: tetratricopeptide repeat protein [Deltaproteobacteria bacterium]|nr:tetratricopeptide repeat protein [Deltaproteobacteria bacterium]